MPKQTKWDDDYEDYIPLEDVDWDPDEIEDDF